MGFYDSFVPKTADEKWKNSYLNDFVDELETFVQAIEATDLTSPIVADSAWIGLDASIGEMAYFGGRMPSGAVDPNATVINVLGYGADPTGTSNSQASIYLAYLDIVAAGGGVLLIPPGQYMIGGSSGLNFLNAQDDVTVMGFGDCSHLFANPSSPAGYPVIQVTGGQSGFRLENLKISGNGATDVTHTNNLVVQSTSETSVEYRNVTFSGGQGTAVLVGSANTNTKFIGCRFNDAYGGNSTSFGASVDTLRIEHCMFNLGDAGEDAIIFNAADYKTVVRENIVQNCTRHGIKYYATGAVVASGAQITGNVVDNTYRGITVWHTGSTSANHIYDTTVDANIITNTVMNGLLESANAGEAIVVLTFENSNTPSIPLIDQLIISGNIVGKSESNGISLTKERGDLDPSPVTSCIVSENAVYDVGLAGSTEKAISVLANDGTDGNDVPAKLISVIGNAVWDSRGAIGALYHAIRMANHLVAGVGGVQQSICFGNTTARGGNAMGEDSMTPGADIFCEGFDLDVAHNHGSVGRD